MRIGVVRADEHRRAHEVARALQQRMEHVLLALRALGHQVVVVAVDLGAHDERDVRIAEVADHALAHVRQRNVVRIDRDEEVVAFRVGGEPCVEVPVLGLRLVRTRAEIPLRDSLARPVVHAQPRACRAYLGVITLVEQPDVERSVMRDPSGRLERSGHDRERLLARDDRRQEGNPGPGLGHDRDRVERPQGRETDREHVEQPEDLDDREHYDHADGD